MNDIDRIAEIRARADAALPGPWITEGELIWNDTPGDPMAGTVYPENAEFIAAARADVPWLLDELEQARAERDRARVNGGVKADLLDETRQKLTVAQHAGNDLWDDLNRAIAERDRARATAVTLEQELAAGEEARQVWAQAADKRLAEVEAERDKLGELVADGEASDGYHTHNELYEYRLLYNAHAALGWIAAGIPVVKSWRHHDGEACFGGGWFIVTAELPTGQVSNHYAAEHWGMFDVPEVELAPEWDGHTPADAADRLRAALDREASRG